MKLIAFSIAAACLLLIGCGGGEAREQVSDDRSVKTESVQKALAQTYWYIGHADAHSDKVSPLSSRAAYKIGAVQELDNDRYLLSAYILKDGKTPLLPIPVPVNIEVSGERFIIDVPPIGFPGLGTYSAQFTLTDSVFSGSWKGHECGGWFFGKLSSALEEKDT